MCNLFPCSKALQEYFESVAMPRTSEIVFIRPPFVPELFVASILDVLQSRSSTSPPQLGILVSNEAAAARCCDCWRTFQQLNGGGSRTVQLQSVLQHATAAPSSAVVFVDQVSTISTISNNDSRYKVRPTLRSRLRSICACG
jgi:hypothetical protein